VGEAEAFRSLAWVLGIAALTPIVLGLLPRLRLPEVVLLLALGMTIGPYGLGLAHLGDQVAFVSDLGLGMLFLLAGMEVDPDELRTRDGARAVTAWLVSLGSAVVWMFFLGEVVGIPAWGAIAIAMTSTALGTLLPLLRDTGLQQQEIGRLVLANGAIGEFGPILAMSVFLSQGSTWGALLSLAAFVVVAALIGFLLVRHSPRAERVIGVVRHGAETTAQAPVRLVILLLAVMLAMSASLGLDVILGAFVAGAIIRMLLPADHTAISARLDGIGYGFLIPVFFVVSGMGIDPVELLHHPGTVLFVFVSILLLRGGPVYLMFRHLGRRLRLQLGLFSATGLPIIVAVTTVAVDSGEMTHVGQSIVVGAGMLTVLLLPVLALSLHVPDEAAPTS
jgi:Kef-type K+ transport system membrane component KefB